MTKKEKQLLLKDLCARLPYSIWGLHRGEDLPLDVIDDSGAYMVPGFNAWFNLETVSFKPYLRPMSSMTEEEREDWYRQSKVDYDCEFKPEPTLSPENCHLSVDWLNKYGFDYRGLIPMGLAIEAKEGMYKTK